MKTSTVIAAFLAGGVAAYPNMDKMTAPLAAKAYEQARKRAIDPKAPQGAGALPLVPPPFDAKSQFVSTTGDHKVSKIFRYTRIQADSQRSGLLRGRVTSAECALA